MDLLKDPTNDRMVKTLKPPPHRPLSRNLMFPDKLKNKPDWKLIRDHLHREGRIAKEELFKLVSDCNKLLKNEGNIIYLQDPLTVVGDIHGQYYDLLKLLDQKVGGNPETTKYLFLGDFVDRGSYSIEVIILMYALKLSYPQTIYFLRGNHECRQLTSFFNFKDECLYKYDQDTYDMLMDSFDLFPIACIINGKFIAIHGGISPDLKTIDDIKKIDRFHEPPRVGLFCDLLWSDPVEDGKVDGTWRQNEVRGCSWFFGIDASNKFLQRNGLISIIRAHEAQLEGYKLHCWNGVQDFPVVITIFSAPNYCDVYNNKGAVIKFENNQLNIQQFQYTPHPYLLPNFMDIFTWSIPFVAEKVTEMLYNILQSDKDSDDEKVTQGDIDKFKQEMGVESKEQKQAQFDKQNSTQSTASKNKEKLKSKIKFVSTMMKMQRTLREQNEEIVQLKGACPDKRLPRGLLMQGGAAINNVISRMQRHKMWLMKRCRMLIYLSNQFRLRNHNPKSEQFNLIILMQDKQIISLLEKYYRQTDPKQLYQLSTQITERVTNKDKHFIIDRLIAGLQSTEVLTSQNYALLLSSIIDKLKDEIDIDSLLENIDKRLSKTKAYNKSEYKHFQLAKYMVYTYLDSKKLLTYIVQDRASDDQEYCAYLLIKQLNPSNYKQITQSVKSEVKTLNARTFSILVALQKVTPQGSFSWDKLLQEKVFTRPKLLELITECLEVYPKKSLFFKYLMVYLSTYASDADAGTVYSDFWNYILALELPKGQILVLLLFKYGLKAGIPLEHFKIQPLIELWYRSMGSSNKFVKKLAHSIEKAITFDYDFIVFIRSIYGYRINPKNILSQQFKSFSEEQVIQYFKFIKKQFTASTDPQQKLHYLNELYVLSVVAFDNLKDQFHRYALFIYEKGCTNFEQFYESLDEEAKESYDFDETKKKVEDQCQSLFFSMVGKAAADKDYFSIFIQQFCSIKKDDEVTEKMREILSLENTLQFNHLVQCVTTFAFIHREEGLQILEELHGAAKEMNTTEPKLKKKVKVQQIANKVITEVCVQLLTKSSQYIRDAINACFKSMKFDIACFDILLDILTKEDVEYITEMQQEEVSDGESVVIGEE